MDNNQKYGYIYLETNKPSYYPGDTVYGYIHLKLLKEFPGNTLYLKINGIEETHWDDPKLKTKIRKSMNPRDSNVKKVNYHSGKTIFFCHKYTINKWQNTSIPIINHMKFPFSFELQNYIPASFFYRTSGFQGKVSYKLTAYIDNSEKKDNFNDIPKLKYRVYLIIKEQNKCQLPKVMDELLVNVKKFVFFNKGNFWIKLSYDNLNYKSGDKIILNCEVDNSNCGLNINLIKIVLYRQLILKSDQGGMHEFIHEIINVEFKGVASRKVIVDEAKYRSECILQYFNPMTNNYEELQPTTTGRIITCRYYFKIKPIINGSCLSLLSLANFEIPLVIFPFDNPNHNNKNELAIEITDNDDVYGPEIPIKTLIFSEAYSYDKSHVPKKMDFSNLTTNSGQTIRLLTNNV